MKSTLIHRPRFILLGVTLLFASTRSQLHPDRQKHTHLEYVWECMQPFLDESAEPVIDNVEELQFKTSTSAHLVQVAPSDGDAMTEAERDILYDLATCIAHVGQEDPHPDPEEPPEIEDWTVDEDTFEKVWTADFNEHSSIPHTHTEEREFAAGGNRVVFINEFLQEILPDLYWKIRHVAEKAVQVGKEAGLFDHPTHVPVQHLGMRCAEYVEYNVGAGYDSKLGWHTDTDSVYTLVFMLAERGHDFEGGNFIIKGFRGTYDRSEDKWTEDEIEIEAPIGSAVVFDAEILHRVTHVSEGRRRAVVFEFWEEADSEVWWWRPNAPNAAVPPPVESLTSTCDIENGLYQRSCFE